MAGTYEQVHKDIWEELADLPVDAIALYMWAFTNRRCGMAGIYTVAEKNLLEGKLTPSRLQEALAALAEAEHLFYVPPVLWVKARVKRLPSKTGALSRTVCTSIARDLAAIEAGHPLRHAFVDRYGNRADLIENTEFAEVAARTIDTPCIGPSGGTDGVSIPPTAGSGSALTSQTQRGSTGGIEGVPLPPVGGASASGSGEQQRQEEDARARAALPEGIRRFVDPVLEILTSIAEQKPGAAKPAVTAVCRALGDYPHRDFIPIAKDYRAWQLENPASRHKDVVRGYRSQLDRKPDVVRKTEPDTVGPASAPGAPRQETREQRIARVNAEREEALREAREG